MNNFAVVELQGADALVHGEYESYETAEAQRLNIRRRAKVTGECVVAMYDEAVDVNESFAAAIATVDVFEMPDRFIAFSDAAAQLGVRYQQLYQRAVVKGKMMWQQRPALFVRVQDVEEWQAARALRNK
jgi:hypothetical protein